VDTCLRDASRSGWWCSLDGPQAGEQHLSSMLTKSQGEKVAFIEDLSGGVNRSLDIKQEVLHCIWHPVSACL
jgi:hypothetical protein